MRMPMREPDYDRYTNISLAQTMAWHRDWHDTHPGHKCANPGTPIAPPPGRTDQWMDRIASLFAALLYAVIISSVALLLVKWLWVTANPVHPYLAALFAVALLTKFEDLRNPTWGSER